MLRFVDGASEFVVEAVGLGKRFGPVTALDALDLEVPRQSIFGFLGPNGAGKTTAMRLLLGLVRPSAGRATVLGLDIVEDSVEIRRRVGYLPQYPRFYDDLTARETLRYTLGFFPHDSDRSIESDIDEVLDLVGLVDRADQRTENLSGGERQRLGIAQAQIHRPELLILDEPASALDPLGRRNVLQIMKRLRETSTVFYSTHILDDVQRVSDTVAILNRGVRVAQAQTDDLLSGGGTTFELTLLGDAATVTERLLGTAWVERVDPRIVGDTTSLTVSVTDAPRARSDLLRLVLEDRKVVVIAFRAARSQLEDVFVEIVEGSR